MSYVLLNQVHVSVIIMESDDSYTSLMHLHSACDNDLSE